MAIELNNKPWVDESHFWYALEDTMAMNEFVCVRGRTYCLLMRHMEAQLVRVPQREIEEVELMELAP